jgi:hypothetical protein
MLAPYTIRDQKERKKAAKKRACAANFTFTSSAFE